MCEIVGVIGLDEAFSVCVHGVVARGLELMVHPGMAALEQVHAAFLFAFSVINLVLQHPSPLQPFILKQSGSGCRCPRELNDGSAWRRCQAGQST